MLGDFRGGFTQGGKGDAANRQRVAGFNRSLILVGYHDFWATGLSSTGFFNKHHQTEYP